MSRASSPGPRSRTTRPVNRGASSREADRIKSTRAGWAAPAEAVGTFWRSGPLPLPVAGFAAGLWASLTGLAIAVVSTLIVWIFAAGESASDTAMRVGADIWLVAHGTPFTAGDGMWTLLPWAWIVFPAATLWAAGRWVAHRAAVAHPKSVAVAALSLASGYAAVALLAALFGTLSGVWALPARAALHAGVLALVVSSAAMVMRARLGTEVLQRAWRLARPTVGALATLTVGACIVLAAAIVLSHGSAALSLSQIQPGIVGSIALLIGWLGYVPATLMWGLSYAVGTGIDVAGTTVTPTSGLPESIDMLGLQLLPTTNQPWWLVGMLIPVAAGVVLSRLAGDANTWRAMVLERAAAIGLFVIAIDLWWAISVGTLGVGRLGSMGPSPLVIAVLTVALVIGVLIERLAMWAWHRRHPVEVIDLTDEPEDVPA